jgi:cytochrome c oxidase assembly protein subunit 11
MSLPVDTLREKSNRKVGVIAAGFAAAMLGATFASAPLYDLFCRVTGFGGTTMVSKAAPGQIGERKITVRFDGNVTGDLGWRFQPEAESITVRPGEVHTVYYRISNPTNRETTGVASYGVVPETSGGYFSKIQCFCFTDQTLKPGESRDEPVVFYIDPEIERNPDRKHIHTITLSYTFFPSKTAKPLAAALGQGVVAR